MTPIRDIRTVTRLVRALRRGESPEELRDAIAELERVTGRKYSEIVEVYNALRASDMRPEDKVMRFLALFPPHIKQTVEDLVYIVRDLVEA